VYAAFDGHMLGDYKPYLLESKDLGHSWHSIAGNLPAKGTVYAVVDDPKDSNILYVGTEFGLFFTRNGGQQWTRLRGGLPTIQVSDLVIQKGADDLVVGTFGRGMYILDDLELLRAATPAVLAQDATLLPVRRTPLYGQSNLFGAGTTGWRGGDIFSAANPAFGATFAYTLKSEIRTRRAQRDAAERTIARRGGDVFYPSWDSLRVEDREEAPAILLTVSDAQGKVVRRLTGPTTAGVQHVTWDLRYAGATLPRPTVVTDDDEEEGPRGNGAGPFVTPGTYTVALAKRVDGTVTALGQPQHFEVYALDGVPARAPTVLAFEQQVIALQRAVTGASSFVDELSTRTQTLGRAIDQTPAAAPQLSTEVRNVEHELRDMREALSGDPTIGRRQEPNPPSLLGRLQVLAQTIRGLDAPTATQQHQYDIVSGEFARISTRLHAIVDTDLKRVETSADAAGVPWTSGRLPDWKP
jgi:hypothetical protein